MSDPLQPTSPHPAAHFCHPVRIYWEDTDAGGVVFYANYLKFFERARTEWLRSLGFGQQALANDTGAIFVVSQTQVRYRRPARLDDALRITVLPTHIGRAGFSIAQQAWRGEELLCEGEIDIACVDRNSFKPRRIPAQILARLQPSASAPPTP